jgi:RNA polymerase sigma factor (sigma-70 family)
MSRLAAYAESSLGSADTLVREYLPLVKKIALRLTARLPAEIELDDLLQVGLMALLAARDSYDAEQGATFATYAGIRIKGAMLDEVRAHDWLPRSVQGKLRKVAEAIERVDARLGPARTGRGDRRGAGHAGGLPASRRRAGLRAHDAYRGQCRGRGRPTALATRPLHAGR